MLSHLYSFSSRRSLFDKTFAMMFVLLLALPSHADQYFVELTATSGVSTELADTVTELVKSEVKSAGQELVLDPKEADYVLAPSILKLGSSMVLKIDKLKKGKVVFSRKLKAQKVEELDEVSERLTYAVIEETSIRSQERVGKIRKGEEDSDRRRRKAAKRWYFGVGPAFGAHLNTGDIFYAFEGAYSFDINRALIRIFWESAFGDGTAIFQMLGLGVNFFSSDRDTAWVYGGDFGFGWAKESGNLLSGDSASGFALGGGIGISFFRTSSINVEIMTRARVITRKGTQGLPILYSLKLGVYF